MKSVPLLEIMLVLVIILVLVLGLGRIVVWVVILGHVCERRNAWGCDRHSLLFPTKTIAEFQPSPCKHGVGGWKILTVLPYQTARPVYSA